MKFRKEYLGEFPDVPRCRFTWLTAEWHRCEHIEDRNHGPNHESGEFSLMIDVLKANEVRHVWLPVGVDNTFIH